MHIAQHNGTHLQCLLSHIHTSAHHIFSMGKDNVLESLLILQTVHLVEGIRFGNWI